MALDRLPGSILGDIVEYSLLALCESYARASQCLQLRLINRQFNEQVSKAFFDRDVTDIHGRLADEIWFKKPTGIALQNVVRGHIVRPPTENDVLNTIRRSLRDGVLIASVILAPASGPEHAQQLSNVSVPEQPSSTDGITSKALNRSNIPVVDPVTDEQGGYLPDYALAPICKAYVDLLGDVGAFDSWGFSFDRDTQFEMLNDKTGHFWAFLAIANQGQPEVVARAAKACIDRFRNDEDTLKLKTIFAAGLLLMAKQGHTEAVKALLTHSDMRINLRLQSIRFPRDNAFDVAVGANQHEMTRFLIDGGWNLTIVPMDYVRALRAVIIKMEPCQLRLDLLKTLLEGTCQQWRSDAIVTGMYNELAKRGDIETCKIIMALHRHPASISTEYRWQWDIKDNATSETITGVRPTNDDDDEDFIDEWDAANNLIDVGQRAALYYAVINKHRDMISFIFDAKERFPTSMSLNFETRIQIQCLEHTIKKFDFDTFQTLLKYTLPEIAPCNLFFYAVLLGNIDVMTNLLPLVDLNAWANSASSKKFYDWSTYRHPELKSAERNLEDYTNPGSLYFSTYDSIPRTGKIGTFMLVCAIKALQVRSVRFLLANGCKLGTRLLIISPRLFDVHHARILICHNCGDDIQCDDCKLRISRFGKWMAMFSLSRFRYSDVKHMYEGGATIPKSKTTLLTLGSWWHLWRWKPTTLHDMDARIITGITIPPDIATWFHDGDTNTVVARLAEMQALMRCHHMPELYWCDA